MMFGWMLDPLYISLLFPAMALAGLATFFTYSTFQKYSRYSSRSGMSGAQAASVLLRSRGIFDVHIEPVEGFLSDHYDPATKTLRLSPKVYHSPSLSAIGVACHEAGHALQHADGYAPLNFRSQLVPITRFGSNASYFLFFIGMLFSAPFLMKLGALLFGGVVMFSLATLPVEWNATSRAKKLMIAAGIVDEEEASHAGAVLNAAFLTYVASAFTAVMTFLYYLLRSGLLTTRDD